MWGRTEAFKSHTHPLHTPHPPSSFLLIRFGHQKTVLLTKYLSCGKWLPISSPAPSGPEKYFPTSLFQWMVSSFPGGQETSSAPAELRTLSQTEMLESLQRSTGLECQSIPSGRISQGTEKHQFIKTLKHRLEACCASCRPRHKMSWRNYSINNSFCLLCLSSLMTPLSTFCAWTLLNLPTEKQWPWSLTRLRRSPTGHIPLPAAILGLPIHRPLGLLTEGALVWWITQLPRTALWWDLQCTTVCFLISSCKWGTPLGDLVLPLCPPFSTLSSILHLRERQASRCSWHREHRNGKAARQVTEKQTHWGIGRTGIKCLMEEIW